jgi:hypothetical protein
MCVRNEYGCFRMLEAADYGLCGGSSRDDEGGDLALNSKGGAGERIISKGKRECGRGWMMQGEGGSQ